MPERLDEVKKVFEVGRRAEVGVDVDAWDPPEVGVAPVGPFEGDHELSDDLAGDVGEVVAGGGGLGDGAFDPGAEPGGVEGFVLGLEGHGGVVRGKGGGV